MGFASDEEELVIRQCVWPLKRLDGEGTELII